MVRHRLRGIVRFKGGSTVAVDITSKNELHYTDHFKCKYNIRHCMFTIHASTDAHFKFCIQTVKIQPLSAAINCILLSYLHLIIA